MYCQKCGYELNDDDLFCENCGNDIRNVNYYENNNSLNHEGEKLKKRKINKKLILLLIICLFGLIAGSLLLYSETNYTPVNCHMEANELATIMKDEKKEEWYYGYDLYIHGYLKKDFDKSLYDESTYILYTNNENDGILFSFEEGLSNQLGNGSELVIKGRLGYFVESEISVFLASDIDVKKAENSIFWVGDTSSLLENAEKYINEIITVEGIPFEKYDSTLYLYDRLYIDGIVLEGIDKYQLGEDAWSHLVVTGKLKLVQGQLVLEVIDIDW